MSKFHRSAEWAAFTRKARPILRAALPSPCVNAGQWVGCRGVVFPGERFDVAHIRSHHLDPLQLLSLESVGVAHYRCNRAGGSREAAAKRKQVRANSERLPEAGSGW